jgi:NAD+ kinase
MLAVEVLPTPTGAVIWADGRRKVELPGGARIEVRRGSKPVQLARLAAQPFTDRLVAKFELPVRGWRGRSSQ